MSMEQKKDRLGEDTSSFVMSGALVYSLLIHVVFMVFTAVGLPYVSRDPVTIAPPVTVELVDISELTQTTKVSAPKKSEKIKESFTKAPPQKRPAPPKVDALAPPDLSQPRAPNLKKEDVANADPIPTPEALKKPVKKPEMPKKKPKLAKKKEPQKAQTQDFQSLLKNLATDVAEQNDLTDKAKADAAEKSQVASLATRMTISEQDALRRQLTQCWNIMAGAKFAENIVVKIRISMNPDRTIKQASIADKGRYNRDSHFRAAADAAVRALRDPRCTPLQLPLDKYDQWKIMVINFDPRDIL